MAVLEWVASILHRGEHATFDARRYWETRHRDLAGKLAAVGHRNLTEQDNAQQYRVKREQISAMMERHVPRGERPSLLEAGCGCGVLTPHFLEMGFDVTAIDFSAKAIEQAKRRAPSARFRVASLSDFDLHQRFDAIAVIDVLLHIVDDSAWRSALVSLARHLKPDGKLILLDTLRDVDDSPEHCRFRPLDAYLEAFNDLGLRIAEHTTFQLQQENAVKDLLAVKRSVAADGATV